MEVKKVSVISSHILIKLLETREEFYTNINKLLKVKDI